MQSEGKGLQGVMTLQAGSGGRSGCYRVRAGQFTLGYESHLGFSYRGFCQWKAIAAAWASTQLAIDIVRTEVRVAAVGLHAFHSVTDIAGCEAVAMADDHLEISRVYVTEYRLGSSIT